MTAQRMPYVWMYHSVTEYESDPYQVTVTPARFENQLRWLADRGLRGVAVAELLAARGRGEGEGLVGLTFDDGYADFAAVATPILLRYGFTATVYVLAERVGGGNDWNHPGPYKALMTDAQLREVSAAGMEIGSHGLWHRSLPELPEKELVAETRLSRERLADILGDDVHGFAYPYGVVGRREIDAVRAAGYAHACAIWPSADAGRFALVRTFVGERDRPWRLRAKQVRHRYRQYMTAVA